MSVNFDLLSTKECLQATCLDITFCRMIYNISFVRSLNRLSKACLETQVLELCSISIQYSDNEGLLLELVKKTVSIKDFGEIFEDLCLKPDSLAIDSMLSSDTNFDR